MNERWFQNQESSFPRIQEFHTSPPITLKALGIEDLREKRLGLDNEQIIVISVKNSQNNSTNYFAFYDHPFVGAHLAHFLNAEAPYKVDPQVAKGAILADYKMPARATNPTDNDLAYKKDKDLHGDHKGDPNIKVPYMEFVEQSLEQQTNALQNLKYDDLFNQVMQLKIINNKAIEPAFSALLAEYKSDKILGKTREEMHWTLLRFPIHRKFIRFLREQPEYYHYPSYETRVEQIVPRFLTQLDRTGQKQLIIARAVSAGATVIDRSTKKIFGDRFGNIDLSLSRHFIEATDHNEYSIQIELQKDSQELYYPFKSVKHELAKAPLEDALYAVIAWNNQDGQRRFLAHHELLDSFPLLNVNWSKRLDAYLGRNLLGYFSPEITDKWPSEIAIEGRPRPQKMMGAQMAVRDSMESEKYPHARQLLAGNVIQKLEEHALAS